MNEEDIKVGMIFKDNDYRAQGRTLTVLAITRPIGEKTGRLKKERLYAICESFNPIVGRRRKIRIHAKRLVSSDYEWTERVDAQSDLQIRG